jgi:hypothetical protein
MPLKQKTMENILKSSLLRRAFLLVLVITGLTLFIHAQEISLMPSGDPEAEGWEKWAVPESLVQLSWSEGEGRDKGSCFHISAGDVGMKTFGWTKKVEVPLGAKALAFSVWVRGKSATAAWIVATGLRTDPSKSLLFATTWDPEPLKGDFEWTRIETVLPLKPDIKQAWIHLYQHGSGEVWYDGLTMRLAELPVIKPEIGPGIVEVIGSLQVVALKTLSEPHLLFPLPLANGLQTPLTFRLRIDPATALARSRIYEDKPGNWMCELYLAKIKPEKPVAVRWTSMVLCAPDTPPVLAEKIEFPKRWPKEVKPWLKSTYSVESDDPRFKAIAKEILAKNYDILSVIREAFHRDILIERQTLGEGGSSQRSTIALEKTAACTGRANRLAAILRACGVPARIMAGYPNEIEPLATHYRVEAYVPAHGWTPVNNIAHNGNFHGFDQIEVSVVYPENEDLAKRRIAAVEGVPYLSLNESPGWDGYDSYGFEGGLASGSCDHSATQWCSYDSEISKSDWDKIMKTAGINWMKWLKSANKWQSGKLETLLTQEQLKDISFKELCKLLE